MNWRQTTVRQECSSSFTRRSGIFDPLTELPPEASHGKYGILLIVKNDAVWLASTQH